MDGAVQAYLIQLVGEKVMEMLQITREVLLSVLSELELKDYEYLLGFFSIGPSRSPSLTKAKARPKSFAR